MSRCSALCCLVLASLSSASLFNLTVLHTNDVHSRFVEFNEFGGRCPEEEANAGKCFGGFARQVTKVNEVRAKEPNVLYLSAGDYYQGTLWYTYYKGPTISRFLNLLGLDAMALGNHEFDNGIEGLWPILNSSNFDILCCNADGSEVNGFGSLVKRSIVKPVAGENIGIIGYITPDTSFLSDAGKVKFSDEIECLQKEAEKMTRNGINKIIAVGHSGFSKDKEIAEKVKDVDIVVGGHTNTFLYMGKPPSSEKPVGPYPIEIIREDGSKALVVQDFAYGKYMGHLQVQFDSEGRIKAWGGNPILLDKSVPKDANVMNVLSNYVKEVEQNGSKVVGQTKVLLCGDRFKCRMKECNLGNLLADSAVHYFSKQHTNHSWTQAAVAAWNSGGIRASVDEQISKGDITMADILSVAPFYNVIDLVELKGSTVRAMLEHSVSDYDTSSEDPPGSFLQVSGLQVKYRIDNPPGSRVVDVKIRCHKCRVPRFLPLDDNEIYPIAMNSYIAKGGDGFYVVKDNIIQYHEANILDVDIILDYLKQFQPVISGEEGRIVITTGDGTMTRAVFSIVFACSVFAVLWS